LSVLDMVIMGDSALHLRACTKEDMWAAAAQRRRGAPRLRASIPPLDGRSESPWESMMRMLHFAAEVEVQPQKNTYDDWGRFVARADLWLVGTRRILSTTVRGTAIERHIARTSRANDAWSRSTRSASGSPHRSCSTKEDRSSLASIGCWVVPGTHAT
jgi:hypothetical protein